MTEGAEASRRFFAFDPADRPEGDDAQAFTLVSADEDYWNDKKMKKITFIFIGEMHFCLDDKHIQYS